MAPLTRVIQMMTTTAFQTNATSTPLVAMTVIKMARMTLAKKIPTVTVKSILVILMMTTTVFQMNVTSTPQADLTAMPTVKTTHARPIVIKMEPSILVTPDDDNDGIPDECDIDTTGGADCDQDGEDDSCQNDQDGDGLIDPCDL